MVKFFSISWLAILSIGLSMLITQPANEITLQAEIMGCGSNLHLYTFDGFGFKLVQSAQSKEQNFSFTIDQTDPQFFYIGPSERNAVPIILGQEKQISVKGDCGQLRQMEFVDSPINDGYRELKKKMEDYNRRNSSLMRSIQSTRNDPDKKEELLQQLKTLDEERLAFLNTNKQENPLFGSIVSLNTYLSFPHYGQDYDNELDYFAESFFKFADFKEDVYAKIPWTYESFKGYATTLSSVGLPDEIHKTYMEKALALIETAS